MSCNVECIILIHCARGGYIYMYRVIIDFIANQATPCPGAFLALLYFNDHSSVLCVHYFVTQIRLMFILKSWKTIINEFVNGV